MSDGTPRSRLRVRSLSLRDFRGVDRLDLDLTGADPGSYVIEYTARDIASDKSAVISLPFTLTN